MIPQFKTPRFWYTKAENATMTQSTLITLLSPLAKLYQIGHNLNLKKTTPQKAALPVICVGNITAGGSGKTPTCIALYELIRKHELCTNPYFLTRGYGGNEPGPRRIEGHDTVHEVGDEPLLLANHSNTIISRNRYEGAKKARDLGADIIIMDDGLQNPGLIKDLSFLVIDGTLGLGNQKTLPAGPLREPLAQTLKRTHAVIIIGKDTYNAHALIPDQIPVFTGHITASITTNDSLPNTPYIAFAGIGLPQKFYATLRNNNLDLRKTFDFPDHYTYTEKDLKTLMEMAEKTNTTLITTEKDHVRLPKVFKKNVYMYPVTLKWDNESTLLRWLIEKIKPEK